MAVNGKKFNGKKLNVYTIDNWNQMNIHMHGRRYVVSEINSHEGEFTYDFDSKQEMVRWAEHRFASGKFDGPEEERTRILAQFKQS
jgi:hypothetical protein